MVTESKTIFVTGATGNQGGAVVRSLLNKGFKVKALTRNLSSVRAMHLLSLGAEVVQGDLNDRHTFKKYLHGVRGVFSIQTFEKGVQKEIQQGFNIADMAKEYHIDHLIYSSVVGADLHTGIPHWDSKYKIENHIRQIGQPFTIIRPASFFENFLIPQVRSRIIKGKLVLPVNKPVIQQFIAARDIGEITANLFMNAGNYIGKTITIAAEEMDQQTVANTFSEVLGKPIEYKKLPSLITRLAMGKDLHKMFSWINENGGVFIKDLNVLKKEFPGTLSLAQWIKLYFK